MDLHIDHFHFEFILINFYIHDLSSDSKIINHQKTAVCPNFILHTIYSLPCFFVVVVLIVVCGFLFFVTLSVTHCDTIAIDFYERERTAA